MEWAAVRRRIGPCGGRGHPRTRRGSGFRLGLPEAQKTFRRRKADRQLPVLRKTLQEHMPRAKADSALETIIKEV